MLRCLGRGDGVNIEISSSNSHIETVAEFCSIFLREHGLCPAASFTLVLRELISNAIRHGNRSEARRLVSCSLSLAKDSQFKLSVEDEGDGFDFKGLDLTMPDDPRHASHRGLRAVNALSDRIEFNDRGNRVTVYITAQRSNLS